MLRLHFTKIPKTKGMPSKAALNKAAQIFAAMTGLKKNAFEASVVFLSPAAMTALNHDFCGKKKPTNVLSFPQLDAAAIKKVKSQKSIGKESVYLGDVLLCLNVLKKECVSWKKPLNHHVMHLVVHGLAHLLGYDHMTGKDARKMEALETKVLAALSLPDPYTVRDAAPNRPHRRTKGSRSKK